MPDRVLTFGQFELDTRGRQLYRQGRRVRLQEQPLRLLEALLEDPGRPVTRQELQQRLWPSGIHVDFELGLTGAVKRLRQALDDSADNPRFIETVPKVGFRFIAPVQLRLVPDASSEPPVVSAPAPPSSMQPPRRRPAAIVSAVTLVVMVAIAYALRPEMPALRVTSVRKITNSGHAWTQESLMTDGARLYYTEYTTEKGFQLRQVVLNGNEDVPVASVPSDSLVRALSPDHTTFTTVSRASVTNGQPSPLWLVPVVGGEPRRLGNLTSNDFAWSPDGRTIVFARESALVLSDAPHETERELARVSGHPICPRWSPDGRVIRFVIEDARGQLALWEVDVAGGHLHRLDFSWPGSPMESFGDWAPGNRYFVFSSRRGDSSDLWALQETADWWHRERTAPVQLTSGPLDYFRPLPSTDGTRLFALGIELAGELLRYDASRRDFVPFLGGKSIDQVSFSRDGQWVVYVTFPDAALWRARLDGSEALQLTTTPVRAGHPRWSPDGRQIAFVARRPGELSQIFVISTDGGAATALAPEPHAQTDPVWSAAGDSIIYGQDHASEADLAILRCDLRNHRPEKIANTDGLFAPVLSPDGRRIATQASASRAIVIVDVETGERHTLVSHLADYATWSADSRYLYFNTLSEKDRFVGRVDVRDGREERVADVPFDTRGLSGSWSGLAPDGSPLILADRSKADVYVLSLTDR